MFLNLFASAEVALIRAASTQRIASVLVCHEDFANLDSDTADYL
jgi:hypothetical protein